MNVDYHHQAVRDLAFMLQCHPLWPSPRALPPGILLGEAGSELLGQLDQQPAVLVQWLSAMRSQRLGIYAERLLHFWLTYAPHCHCVAANQAVRSAGRTLGAFDFLTMINGAPWHIETTAKFYLQLSDPEQTLVGPNLNDALLLKADKLEQQLTLSNQAEAAAVLPTGFDGCRVGAHIVGWLFVPLPAWADNPPRFVKSGWHDSLHGNWRFLYGSNIRWAVLTNKLLWLSRVSLPKEDTWVVGEVYHRLSACTAPALIVALEQSADGRWGEISRGFVTPANWPYPDQLSQLKAKLATLSPSIQ